MSDAQVNLSDAVDRISHGSLSERKRGLADLTHILRYNQQKPKVAQLNSKTYLWLYQELFRLNLAESSSWLNAKTATTASTAETRLSNAATALRLSVELGVRSINVSTVQAVLDHVGDTMLLPDGSLCPPLALDYAKCLRAALSYQPHVEHLSAKDWERTVLFCVTTIKNINDPERDGTKPGDERRSTSGATNGNSVRSSRSQIRDNSSVSQTTRTVTMQVSDELISALALLTGATNAPLAGKAQGALSTVVDFLKRYPRSSTGRQPAFTVINSILAWAQTEDIVLVKKATGQLLRLIQHGWEPKPSPLKDEMIITLLYLRPYIAHLMVHDQAVTLRNEIRSLSETARMEYGKLGGKEQLQIEDLRLVLPARHRSGFSNISTSVISLRPAGMKAEHNWALVNLLATLSEHLDAHSEDNVSSDDDEEGDVKQRPRKRQRISHDHHDILQGTADGSISSRVCYLQVTAFRTAQRCLTVKELVKTIDKLTPCCSDENSTVASWAFVALACCAAQPLSTVNGSLTPRWSSVWQLATRSITGPLTCRAASHLLCIMLQLRLVDQVATAELVQNLTTSLDLAGPSLLADSVLALLESIVMLSQQLSPGSTSALAESVLSWLIRRYRPSMFEDRAYTSTYHTVLPGDIVRLINCCLGQSSSPMKTEQFPRWTVVAQAWNTCDQQHELVSYLLSSPEHGGVVHPELLQDTSQRMGKGGLKNVICESLILNQIISDFHHAQDSWSQWCRDRQGSITEDIFGYLYQVCCTWSYIAYDCTFHDIRRQAQLRRELDQLLSLISKYASGRDCSQTKFEIMLAIMSGSCTGLSTSTNGPADHVASACEQLLCGHVSGAVATRRQLLEYKTECDADDMEMDMDDTYDSQDSRRGQSSNGRDDPSTDSMIASSTAALRANVSLYALIVSELAHAQRPASGQGGNPSSRVVDYLMSLSAAELMASRLTIVAIPRSGLDLHVADVDRLLERCATDLLNVYPYERSEAGVGIVLSLMSSVLPLLTNADNKSLYGLGLDMYEWVVEALAANGHSPNVLKRVGQLLLQLCHVDADYGRDSDMQSARTSLFKLVQVRSIKVQFFLANHVSSIFGRFVLTAHEQIFEDLQGNLPAEADWFEGLALRLLYLSRLASAWHTLLRQCVYYIFETAGRVKETAPYARTCVKQLTRDLGFTSAQKLFRLFAPQLLHTWLEQHTLNGLPFTPFDYASLDELLEHNQAEITAQVLMRGKDDSLHVISRALKVSEKDLAKRSFARAAAYTISWDCSRPSDGDNASSEARLRTLVGGKQEHNALVAASFPTILGHFFLAAQQEDTQDKWLEKRPAYTAAAKALSEARSYSQSTRALPGSQQPSFKSKYLPDQIERLCRRTTIRAEEPWNASSFAQAARMLLDAIDSALGSLHVCLMLRKLRLLICMAGSVATKGFPLEMLVHSIRPFLSDSQCADDALGVLQYLLHQGLHYLQADGVRFANGTISVMILQMRAHSTARQESTTQESAHRQTVQKMDSFQSWLVTYLGQCQPSKAARQSSQHAELVRTLSTIRLPGNAHKETAESSLLLLLLEQQIASDGLMSESYCNEALRLLTRGFMPPSSANEDCLGADESTNRYAAQIWAFVRSGPADGGFMIWAARVLSRSYASTGTRPSEDDRPVSEALAPNGTVYEGAANSEYWIARRLSNLVFSPDRLKAGLADWTLRMILSSFHEAADALAFEQMLPPVLVTAVADGAYGYQPLVGDAVDPVKVDRHRLQQALSLESAIPVRDWVERLAAAICKWASRVPVLAPLSTLLRNIPQLAMDFLPYIAHIALADEVDKDPMLKNELSTAMSNGLAQRDLSSSSQQKMLLQLLLYLRGQPYPGEATKVDRTRWLDVDLLVAAEAAAFCDMPAAALLLAECATPIVQVARCASSRASMSQVQSVDVPDELLLRIFKSMEEPDSFYGVQQPASLQSILARLDYEGNGMKSLMFYSAQMDSAMRRTHQGITAESSGLMRSLSSLSFNSLEYTLLSGPFANAAGGNSDMMVTARKLQQWDVPSPDATDSPSAACFSALQELSRALDCDQIASTLKSLILAYTQHGPFIGTLPIPSYAWYNALTALSETLDIVQSAGDRDLRSQWDVMQRRTLNMRQARLEDGSEIANNRSALFSTLAQNTNLLRGMHVSLKMLKTVEAEAILQLAALARTNGTLQEALSAVTQFTQLASESQEIGVKVTAAGMHETATVLWESGEAAASVKMLKDIIAAGDSEHQDIVIGQAGILAKLGHQLAEARLQKPDEILEDCLKPAIKHLGGRKTGQEAGKVFHEFAVFCDKQLQNPSSLEDFQRNVKLRQKKEKQIEELKQIHRSSRKTNEERDEASKQITRAKAWLQLDEEEFKRLKTTRDDYAQQSLQNYLLALHASDEHNLSILRFLAMWLENCDSGLANTVVQKYLDHVPSWKFVVLNNQLLSRLESSPSAFQETLKRLVQRICGDHPHQSLHHLYATTRKPVRSDDSAAQSRAQAAQSIRNPLQNDSKHSDLVKRIFRADNEYNNFAYSPLNGLNAAKVPVKDFAPAGIVISNTVRLRVPPATIAVRLRSDAVYKNVPILEKWGSDMNILSGLSRPKALTAWASDGVEYKQLFKGTKDDDLRQDAIIEQVCEEVSKMLRNHKATRQRNLQVRTYKVIPLTTRSGVIEWVQNSIPIGDWLKPAHMKYYPQSMKSNSASEKIRAVERHSTETRVKEFRNICDRMPPVLRHFFFERFDDPDVWFEKRTAYTRTTAAVSILGWVIGLGDRHCQNIMLDTRSGEAVHIDLGVAFEAGRVLNVPELVPFRLTRDIVDAMGITKTEGVFRRCCEFTMDALREDKDSIMTLLNVLRYDPLYSWSVSPLRARRMQDAAESTANPANGEEATSRAKEQEGGEADRALSVVEKKLSKTLSTAATVNELIQQATDEKNLATLFAGWSAYF